MTNSICKNTEYFPSIAFFLSNLTGLLGITDFTADSPVKRNICSSQTTVIAD